MTQDNKKIFNQPIITPSTDGEWKMYYMRKLAASEREVSRLQAENANLRMRVHALKAQLAHLGYSQAEERGAGGA